MIVARSPWQLRSGLDSLALDHEGKSDESLVRARPRTAFIPTMGALHEGHLALVDAAQRDGNPITVASVFVNPSQFAEGEDFDRYPRDEQRDLELLAAAGCDIVFLPTVDDVYPPGFATSVLADPSLVACLCGASRGRSHFNGVATVVARLFGLVRPDTAWFGEKDWQQLQVIRRMAADLFPAIEICSVETVRSAEGLALSSRNAYLSPAGREAALAIPRAVAAARDACAAGNPAEFVELRAREVLEKAGLAVDYVEVRSASSLERHAAPPRIFIAALLEGVRLIDNASLEYSSNPSPAAGIAPVATSTAAT